MNNAWHPGMAWGIGLVVLVVLCWIAFRTLQSRREARQRIWAARVRSGHVPLEIPSTRGTLQDSNDTQPEPTGHGRHEQVVVDEQPRIHIRYLDSSGKLTERIVQVEHLDVQKRVITSRASSSEEPRVYPLEKIQSARNVETGKPFNLNTWVDAVRVARRRRMNQDGDLDYAQFG